MGGRDKSDRAEFCLKRDHRRIENRPGGTHPGAEQGAMGGSLMLGMVPGMFDRLSLCQSSDGKNAEYQENRQESKGAAFHRNQPILTSPNGTGGSPNLSRGGSRSEA